MTSPHVAALTKNDRRLLGAGIVKALAITVGLIAAYYLLPLDHLDGVPVAVIVLAGLVILTVVSAFQVKSVVQAPHPGVRAIQALAITAPLFLLLFASTYFVMAHGDTEAFNVRSMTRTDSLYFTVTVFSTVGFGDITAVGQSARLLVTAQMILDLVLLGLGIKVFLGAVEVGRKRTEPES